MHQLPGRQPAGAHHARPRQDRLPARHATPHVDPGVVRLALVRIELLADHRMDAVAADRDFALHGRAILELELYAGFILLEPHAMPAKMQPIRAEAGFHRLEKDGLQITAMDRELRRAVACPLAERLL